MKFLKLTLLSAVSVLFALASSSCVKEEIVDNSNGFVQFKLYKQPQTKALSSQLDYLNDAKKVLVNLQFGDMTISQTLTLGASSEAAAEFGLRSDKLELVPGMYQVNSFILYDGVDEILYNGGKSEDSFEVVAGGLEVVDLFAKVQPRGSVKFTLVKPDSFKATKSADRAYTFDEIKSVDITVKNTEDAIKTTFTGLKAKFSIHFDEDGDKTDGYQISTVACDTILSLKAGKYVIDSYMVYDDAKGLLERNTEPVDSPFSVEDNKLTEAKMEVSLNPAAEYLKDYQALKEIWMALDGPNWYYAGENELRGCNWDFNKDMDLWGDQPGVSLHSNGRVAAIDISDFGFRGEIPAAVGQLTALVELFLGTHNDTNTVDYDPSAEAGHLGEDRMELYRNYIAALHPATPMSMPVALAMMENGRNYPEIEMYKTLSEDKVINKATGESVIKPMDTVHGKLCNGLRKIDPAIGNLKNLEKLFIANGELAELPPTMKNLTSLTDIEIYNCPKMLRFPLVLAEIPALISVNLSNNKQWSSEEIEKGFRAMATGAAKAEIQLFYLGFNNMTVFPRELKYMKSISLLDFSYNKIATIEEALGNEIKFIQLMLNNNRISDESWPDMEGKVFFGTDDVESITFSHNNMKTFPNIFTKDTPYIMKSVDFSFNDLQNFPEDFHGIKVETLSMANNPNMKTYPACFAESGSVVSMFNLRACGLETIPKEAFEGENVYFTMSLDLTYNHLSKFPETMHAQNLPYLYGVDVSYNRFEEFPFEPLDNQGLTVLAVRGQRNAKGERCLRQWPNGIARHKGLRGLYLGSNNLGRVNDEISTLCYNLDISDNPEIIFDASDICGAIKAQAFNLIYDKTQDIRNCPILKN